MGESVFTSITVPVGLIFPTARRSRRPLSQCRCMVRTRTQTTPSLEASKKTLSSVRRIRGHVSCPGATGAGSSICMSLPSTPARPSTALRFTRRKLSPDPRQGRCPTSGRCHCQGSSGPQPCPPQEGRARSRKAHRLPWECIRTAPASTVRDVPGWFVRRISHSGPRPVSKDSSNTGAQAVASIP